MMTAAHVIDLFRVGLGGITLVAALVLMLGGVIGLLRFPDFYTRLHANRVAEGVGAVLFLIGLAILSSDARTSLLLLLLALLVGALGPVLTQLQASAAHGGGLAPLAGPYVAPRPGVKRENAQ